MSPGTAPLTPTFGRDDDLAHIVDLLDGGHTRLLTLTGPGGVGKTRLGHEVLARLAPDYAEGGVFVPLAPLTGAGQAPAALARACAIPERGGAPPTEALATALQPQHRLIVLDNFEHLLADAPVWLADLLAACPRITVLVTSRLPLHLTGEWRYPVAPLALPDEGEAMSGERGPAVALFMARAQAVRPALPVNERSRADIAALCRRLDGLPLAIELAAARTRFLTPGELLARLGNRRDLLAGGPRDAPVRHQSLEATIAWSHDLLPTGQQRLFRQLAVFRGGFTLDAAEAVCGPPDGPIADVFGGVEALVDHNLVQALPRADGTTRYRMLETIRSFAAERLERGGEEHAVRDRHAAWAMRLGGGAPSAFHVASVGDSLLRLEDEQSNLHEALSWLDATGRVDDLATLVTALRVYWHLGGHAAQGHAWYARLRTRKDELDPDVYGEMMRWAGQFADIVNDPEAQAWLEEALALAEAGGSLQRQADCQGTLGIMFEDRGEYEEAAVRLTSAQELHRQLGDTWTVNCGDYHLGVVAFGQGDLDEAVSLFDRASAAARAIGDPLVPSWCILYRALIACNEGDTARAATVTREGLLQNAPDFQKLRSSDVWLGAVIAHASGRHELAARLFGAADVASHGIPEALPEREWFDRAEASTRREVGGDRYAAEWACGRQMSKEQTRTVFERLVSGDLDPVVVIGPATPAPSLLTRREGEVLHLLAEGMSNQEIADTLFISLRTAANHVGHILTKLDLGSRTAAVAWAIRHGLA